MGESGRSRWSDSAGASPGTYLAWRFLNGTFSSVKHSSLCGWLHKKEEVIIVVEPMMYINVLSAKLGVEVRTTGERVGRGSAAGALL